jgi:hypothetical protein
MTVVRVDSCFRRKFSLVVGYDNGRHLGPSATSATRVAQVMTTEREIVVRFQKRAHDPLLMVAGFDKTELPLSWLGNRRLPLVFG